MSAEQAAALLRLLQQARADTEDMLRRYGRQPTPVQVEERDPETITMDMVH